MFVEESKKVFANVCLQKFSVGWVEPYNIADKLVFRYIHSWRDIAYNMVSFRKIYLLMTIIVISAFRWTVEVAWL